MPLVTRPIAQAAAAPGIPQISTSSGGSSYRSSRRTHYRGPAKNPGVAAVLSFLWCGLGQIYNGQIFLGVLLIIVQTINVFLMLVLIGFLLWPIFWICGMVNAHNTAERINGRRY